MSNRLTTLLILTLLLPVLARAQVTSYSSASADSGGNSVEQGGVVHTGDVYSSVQVQTTNGAGSGSSTVQVETSVNGQTHKETYTTTGGSIGVSVTASSTGYKTQVWEPGSTTAKIAASSSISFFNEASTSTATRFIQRISNWFARILSFFGW